MTFQIARADAAGARIVASETVLAPQPTHVLYPDDLLGTIQETADQRVIVQQPVFDGRRRIWMWSGYPATNVTYQALWPLLESLRSRHRKSLGYATPFAYLKDDVSGKLRVQDIAVAAGSATSGGASTLTDSTKAWTVNAFAGYSVEILSGTGAGQWRRVLSNTATQLTISPAWTVQPIAASVYSLYGWTFPWFKVRVVDVERSIRPGGGNVKYEDTRLIWVLEDPLVNDLG